MKIRVILFILGVFLMSLGSSFCLEVAYLGLDPWDLLFYGLEHKIGLTFGIWSQIVAVFLLFSTFLLLRTMPKWGTYVDIVLYGCGIDIIRKLDILPHASFTHADWILFAMGIFLLGFGGGMYVASDVGTGPIDGFIGALSEKFDFSFRRMYIVVSLVFLFLGFLLDSPIGWGTLLFSLCLGHLYQFSGEIWKKVIQKYEESSKSNSNSNSNSNSYRVYTPSKKIGTVNYQRKFSIQPQLLYKQRVTAYKNKQG